MPLASPGCKPPKTRLTFRQLSTGTGLWLNERSQKICQESPEATFPLPPELVIRTDAQPPPPSLGELSPGLAMVMIAKCQWSRLATEELSHWNAWLFLGATFFSALTVRLLTSSWTAGLLAAVAVLSRGTLQNRALLAASEPFAAPFVAAAWFTCVAFLRSFWAYWVIFAIAAWSVAILFVPALWPSLVIISLLAATCIRPGAPRSFPWTPGFMDQASYASIIHALPNRHWQKISVSGIAAAFGLAYLMARLMPQSLPSASVLYGILIGRTSPLVLISSLKSIVELVGLHRVDIDWHAGLTVFLIVLHPLVGGRLAAMNRAAALAFALTLGLQIFFSAWIECFFIHSSTTAHPAIVPAARAIEPIFIAWGTASAWRILDLFTGYRLSTSGWSIRGRDTMDSNI